MTQLPKWVSAVQAIFLGLGTFLTILAFQGIPIPAFLTGLFSQATFDLILQAATAVFTLYQAIKAALIVVPKSTPAVIKTLSASDVRAYAWNPFRIAA